MGQSRGCRTRYDAVIVGSGPNGLAAAITLARAGNSVLLIEAEATIGGGTRTAALTLPGFLHDVCSAVHPFAAASPFFKTLPLAQHGLELVHPQAPLAHPLDDGTVAILERSIAKTGESLAQDAAAYRRLMEPLTAQSETLFAELLGPLGFPRHFLSAARFGLRAIQPATMLARRTFAGAQARALFAGLAAHAILPLEQWTTSAVGLVLGIAGHTVGWPVVRGGSQQLAQSLASYLASLGGEVVTSWRVESVDELPRAKAVLLDLTPRQLVRLAGHRLPAGYMRRLGRYRYGMGVFKLDWALNAPIPWRSAACRERERFTSAGRSRKSPPTSRQSSGASTLPDHSSCCRSRACSTPRALRPAVTRPGLTAMFRTARPSTWRRRSKHRSNALRRGSPTQSSKGTRWPRPIFSRTTRITSAAISMEARRTSASSSPARWRRLVPYSTPLPGLYLCSSSTPPGGGVHGLCGYHAALAVLRRTLNSGRKR